MLTEETGLVCRLCDLSQSWSTVLDLAGQKSWTGMRGRGFFRVRQGRSWQKPRGWLWRRQGWPDQAGALDMGQNLHLVGWGGSVEGRVGGEEGQTVSPDQTLEKNVKISKMGAFIPEENTTQKHHSSRLHYLAKNNCSLHILHKPCPLHFWCFL